MTAHDTDADDRVLSRVVTTGGTDEDAVRLLAAFQEGFPVSRLSSLFRSEESRAVRTGVWIASELGAAAAPVLKEVDELLHSADRYVRFFAIDVVLASASAEHGDLIGRVISLIEDADSAVRWKAVSFLSDASETQLGAASIVGLSEQTAGNFEWLRRRPSPEAIRSRLEGNSSERLFAVAAAARLVEGRDGVLRLAAESADVEVSSFAREQLRDPA